MNNLLYYFQNCNSNNNHAINFHGNTIKLDYFDLELTYLWGSFFCSFTAVHKTEVIKNTLNPTWRPFQIAAVKLCNGDYDRYTCMAIYFIVCAIKLHTCTCTSLPEVRLRNRYTYLEKSRLDKFL